MDYSCRRRDPILQINIQSVQQKAYKAPVPSYMKVTSWLESKPKGIGRGQFYNQSEGSFRVGKDSLSAYRPTKKIYPSIPPYATEKLEGSKKIILQSSRNPILEPENESKLMSKKIQGTAFKTSVFEDNRLSSCSNVKKES